MKEHSAPYVIPFFIPHRGCPHRCVFCNQQKITGIGEDRPEKMILNDISREINDRLAGMRNGRERQVQVAFYGGSFTALAREAQLSLLQVVQPFIEKGLVDSVRVSTRPDAIDAQTVSVLKQYRVEIVELGVQSMSPEVLVASGRGHTVEDTEKAFAVLRGAGITVGAQLMVGLPGDRTARLFSGARQLAGLGPDFVRIYPVLVIRESVLAQLYAQGRYRPLSLEKAVVLAAGLKELFDRQGIRVVRMGLQPTQSLEENVVAGPYHPSFGELVLSRLLFRKVRRALSEGRRELGKRSERLRLSIAAADQSIFRGPGNHCLKKLDSLGMLQGVSIIFEPSQPRQTAWLTAL